MLLGWDENTDQQQALQPKAIGLIGWEDLPSNVQGGLNKPGLLGWDESLPSEQEPIQTQIPQGTQEQFPPARQAALPQLPSDTSGMSPEQIREYELKKAGVGVDWRQGPFGYVMSSLQSAGAGLIKGGIDLWRDLGDMTGLWEGGELSKNWSEELATTMREHQLQGQVNLERAIEDNGIVGGAATALGQGISDLAAFILYFRGVSLGLKGLGLLAKGGAASGAARGVGLAAQGAKAGRIANQLSHFKEAAKLASFAFVNTATQGDDSAENLEQRIKHAALIGAYRATPIFSGLAPSTVKAITADVLTNMGISTVTKQYQNAWEQGKLQAEANGDPDGWLAYSIANVLPIAATDVYFAHSTRSFKQQFDRMRGALPGMTAKDMSYAQAENVARTWFDKKAEEYRGRGGLPPEYAGYERASQSEILNMYRYAHSEKGIVAEEGKAKEAQVVADAEKAREAAIDKIARAVAGGVVDAGQGAKMAEDAGWARTELDERVGKVYRELQGLPPVEAQPSTEPARAVESSVPYEQQRAEQLEGIAQRLAGGIVGEVEAERLAAEYGWDRTQLMARVGEIMRGEVAAAEPIISQLSQEPVKAPEGEAKAGVQPPTAPATAPATTQEKVEPVTPALGAATVTAREDVASAVPAEPKSARAGTSEFDTIIEQTKAKKTVAMAKREAKLTQADKAMEWAMKGEFKEGMTFNEALATLPQGVTKAAATKALQQAGWSKGRRSAGMKRGDEPLVRVTVSVPRAGVETSKIEAKGGTVGVTEETPADIVAAAEEAGRPAVEEVMPDSGKKADTTGMEPKQTAIQAYKDSRAEQKAELDVLEGKKTRSVADAKRIKVLREAIAELDKLISEETPAAKPAATLAERLNTAAKPPELLTPEEFIDSEGIGNTKYAAEALATVGPNEVLGQIAYGKERITKYGTDAFNSRIGKKEKVPLVLVATDNGKGVQRVLAYWQTKEPVSKEQLESGTALPAPVAGIVIRNGRISDVFVEPDVRDSSIAAWIKARASELGARGGIGPFSSKTLARRSHAEIIRQAITPRNDVSSSAVDAYGIKLPPGYVREGGRYVFKGGGTNPLPIPDAMNQGLPVKPPRDATFIRVSTAKGSQVVGVNDAGTLKGAGPYTKVEFGTRDMKGAFKPIEGLTTKEAIKEGAVMGFLTLKESARVPKASGGTAYLKANEKFTAYDLGDGRILLKDGKQVTVMEGDLPESVKAQITKTPNITAGGLTPQQIAAREAKSEELPAKWNQATRQAQGKFMAWKNNEANQKQYGFKANNVQAAWEAYRGLTIEGKVQGKKFIRDKEAKDAIIGITNEAKNLAQKNRQSGKLPRPTPLMGFLRKAGRAVFNMSTILQRGLGENAHKLWLNHRTRVGRIFAELRNEHRQTMTSTEAQALYRNADLFQKGKYGALGEVTRQEALEFRNIGLHMAIQEAVRAYDSGGAAGLRAWYEKKVQEPGWEHLKNDLRPLLRTDSKDGMSVDEKQVYILGNDMRELNLSIRDIANIPLNKDEIKLADFLLSRLQKNSEKYGSTRKALSGEDIPLHAIYHPIVRDYKRVGGDLADMVEENNKKAQLYGPTLMTDYDMDKMGIAQTRKSNRIPFIIRGEMDTVNQNAMDTARYIAFTEFFNTWKGIFRSREAVNELRDSIGQDAIDTINRKLDTMEGVIYSDTASEWQRLGSFVLGKTTAAALSGIPIVLYQPSSAMQYGLKFGWKNLAKAVAQILTPEGRSLAKKILQSAPMIINRADDVRIETGLTDTRARAQSLYFTRAWKRTQDKGLRIKGTLEEAQRTALTGLQKADEFAQLLGLLTVYNNYKSTGKALDFNKIAADTESTMVDTQSSADPLDMTGLRLSKSGTVRLLSILSGEASAVFNVVTRAIDNASKIAKAVREGAATVAQRDQAFKTVAETLFTVAAMSAWVATIKAGRDKLLKKEDDEEDFYEKMGWRFLENMTGYLPFPSIFGPTVNELVARTLRDTQRTGKYNIQTQNWYGFGQRLPESILRITKAADQYWKYSSGMSGDRKLTPREAARYAEWAGNNAGKALLGILETTTGVGVEQNARIIDAIMRKTGILTE